LAVQNAGTALNPAHRVIDQLTEPLRQHEKISQGEAEQRLRALADTLDLNARHLNAYPHQLSGGEKQRALLVMALSCAPDILILDEPTGGQDMRARARLLATVAHLRAEMGFALILISHDLAAVAALTERVAVLYAGQFAEMGATRQVLDDPRHPYTWGLLNAYPNMSTARDLGGLRGAMPDPAELPSGCRFHPRCTQAVEQCRQANPALENHDGRRVACHLGGVATLLDVRGLAKSFGVNGRRVQAVNAVSFYVLQGEVVGLVGETGSGKSTLAHLIAGLLQSDSGAMTFAGERTEMQLIPQDPFEHVNPRWTVARIIREPLDIARTPDPDKNQTLLDALDAVGLPRAVLDRKPGQMSGGGLQRVVIARALTLAPKLLIADEPVSMLDPSEAAKLVLTLRQLSNERGMGLLFISHDLALVRKLADRILVLQNGKIIEGGRSSHIITQPEHAYTRDLVAAAPAFDWFENTSPKPKMEKQPHA
ncbi:MAG: ABC transporter ATP-binding protein, partial [Anaerolineales bacterium]